MGKMRRWICAAAFALGCALGVGAPAQADQRFEEALDVWLQGASVDTLTPMAVLARQGDARAQVFLGRVAMDRSLWGREVQFLPRPARNALLRATGGVSGTSWLRLTDTPLARAFLDADGVDTREQGILTLLSMGERAATVQPFFRLIDIGDYAGALAVANHPDALDIQKDNADWLAAAVSGGLQAASNVGKLRTTSLSDETLGWLLEDPTRIAQIAPEVASGTGLAALHVICGPCPASDICVTAIVAATREYLPPRLVSPVETLLPTPAYLTSPRYLGDVARALSALIPEPEALTRLDTCAAAQVGTLLFEQG